MTDPAIRKAIKKEYAAKAGQPDRAETLTRFLLYLRTECQHDYVRKHFSKLPLQPKERKKVFQVLDNPESRPDRFLIKHGLTLGELACFAGLSISNRNNGVLEKELSERETFQLLEDPEGKVSIGTKEPLKNEAQS